MEDVIPVALGEILTEMDILTAAELNRHGAKALAFPKLQSLGLCGDVGIGTPYCVRGM